MLLLSTQLEGMPVHSLQTGKEVGVIKTAIINPNNLVIPAFYCLRTGQSEDLILHADDIREIGIFGAVIDDEDLMMADEDLVRLKKIIELDFTLIGAHVVTDHEHKIGKVGEYVLNGESFLVQKLHVTQSLLKSFATGSRIIDRKQIIKVEGKKIVVREATVKTPRTSPAIVFTPPTHS